jgi:ketosteroid isomerase-like protein
MAPTHTDIIQSGLEAMADGDLPALIVLLHPEIEWHPPAQGTLDEVYVGHDGVERLFESLFDAWERIGHVPTKLVEGENDAVVITRIHLLAKMSGLEIDELWAYYVEFEDDKIRRVWMYTDPEQALKEHSSAVLSNAPDWPG